MANKKAILLLSGGIDSTTLLVQLLQSGIEVTALSFRYGQKHAVELEYAQLNANHYGVQHHHFIDLDPLLFNTSALVNPQIDAATYPDGQLPQGSVNTYVPFRNMLFLTTALSIAESLNIQEVYIAVNKDDGTNFWDCSPAFIARVNVLASLAGPTRVKAPFAELTKREVVQRSVELMVDLKKTITCYQPVAHKECGQCLSCIVKLRSLE